MEPAVLGQEHVFESQSLPMRLRVPGPEYLSTGEDVRGEHAPLRVIAHSAVDKEPTQIAVQTVMWSLKFQRSLSCPLKF